MKNQSRYIRNEIIKNFKINRDFDDMLTAEIDGHNFSAADIAFPDSANYCQVYRLIIIKHI